MTPEQKQVLKNAFGCLTHDTPYETRVSAEPYARVAESGLLLMCWHRWDVYQEVTPARALHYNCFRTTKICRKCGEKRVKEWIR